MKILFLTFCISISLFLKAQKITYNKDISPIIAKHCLNCHYQGGPSPFSLINYKEVSAKATFISYITTNKIMPPWRANPEYSHFSNERLMSDEEIDLVKKWVEGGSKKGGIFEKKIENPQRQELGKADLELMMPEPVIVRGNNQNAYYTYKLPYELDKDTFGKVFEFIPGNTEVLHHATFQILKAHESAPIFDSPYQKIFNTDTFMDDGGYYHKLKLVGKNNEFPDVVYSNSWLPGSTTQIYPDDVGFVIPKRGVILFNFIHYSPSPIEQLDLSGLRFYFSDKSPSRQLREILFKPNFKGNESIIYKDSVKHIQYKKHFREKVSIFTIIPHMHQLGRYFKSYAVDPKGDTIPLVEVKDWDFNWQEYYRCNPPLILERGSAIITEAIFDNTSNNPYNPNTPPKDVYFEDSMDEESEMLHLIFLYSNYREGDENTIIEPAFNQKSNSK